MQIAQIRAHADAVVAAVGHTMFGLEDETRLCLAALFTGGHVLLEGNPGLGKTELVKAISTVLTLPFGRIQFTPDLMPADITGTLMPTGQSTLEFKKGPIFTSLLLADEINRATPKTQSAMLEAMAEKWATVLGVRYALPEPFTVLATQNPIDHEGTYSLPAAQSDRFMFKMRMPVPTDEVLERIVIKRAGAGAPGPHAAEPVVAVAPAVPHDADPTGTVRTIAGAIRSVRPLPIVQSHIMNIYRATNGQGRRLSTTIGSEKDIDAAARRFQYGISPRAAGDIMLAAKAWVCLTDSNYDTVSVSHLKAVVLLALRHRLRPSPDFSGGIDYTGAFAPEDDDAFDAAIKHLVKLTAPRESGSDRLWQDW